MNLKEESPSGAVRGRTLKALDRLLDIISTSISVACVVVITAMLFVMLAAVTLQVVSRYWIDGFVGEPEELARLSMVMMVFLAIPTLAHYSENIRLDVAQEIVKSAAVREWFTRAALFTEFVFLAILAVLSFQFIEQLSHSVQQSPSLGIRLFWTRAPVFVGSALGALVTLCVLGRRIINGPPDEEPQPTMSAI